MKAALPVLAALLFSCTTEREIQADMMDVTLVKIETTRRYPNIEQKVFTWKSSNNLTFITFESESANMQVGYSRRVMVPK